MTREEASLIERGDLLYHRTARQGGKQAVPARAKVTSIQTWVRSPERIAIGLKHGLYQTFRIDETELGNWFRTEAEALKNSDSARKAAKRSAIRRATAPHGRCASQGRCVEHERDESIEPCL